MDILDKDIAHKSIYSLPFISILIALPYFGLCLINNSMLGIPYIFGLFWFVFVCPAVVLIRIIQTLYMYAKKRNHSHPIHKIILLLLPAYLIYGLGLFHYGCAVSV